MLNKYQLSIQTSNKTGSSSKRRMCLKPYVGTQTVFVSVRKHGFFVLHNKQTQQSKLLKTNSYYQIVDCVLLRVQQGKRFEEFQVELVVSYQKQHNLSSYMVVLPCKIGIGIPLESHHDWQHSPGSSCCYFSNDFLVLKNLLPADIPELKNTHVSYLLEASHASLCSKTYMYRCLCKICVRIPAQFWLAGILLPSHTECNCGMGNSRKYTYTTKDGFHVQPPPPLPSKIPECVTPLCPQNSIIVNLRPFKISASSRL